MPAAALAKPERSPLVPLPPKPPETLWSDVARVISQQYAEERAARSPDKQGAPSTLQKPDLLAHVLQGMADGLSPAKACQRIGLSAGQWSEWQSRADANPGNAFAALMQAGKGAHAWREHTLLSRIEKAGDAGPQYWTANAWLMERSPIFARAYALNQGQAGGSVIVNIGIRDSDIRISTVDQPADHGSDDDIIDATD